MIKKLFFSLALIASLAVGAIATTSTPAYAENKINEQACANADPDQYAALGCNQNQTAPSVATTIINSVISILAIVSVIMIVFAGQRYMVAMGDPGKISQAKNMILYGVIGLVIALLAFAVVNFILNGFAGQ